MNDYVYATEVVHGKIVEVILDLDPQNPRDWDNEGLMICFHGKYQLGDKHNYRADNYSDWDEFKLSLKQEGYKSILPLYLLDHSGISMRTGSFNDRWDSGWVGFIVSKEEGQEDNLETEVKIYDQYLRGEAYMVRVFEQIKCECCGHSFEEVYECVGGFNDIQDALRDGRDLANAL